MHKLYLLITTLFAYSIANAQSTVTFTGSGTWTCPAGVTNIQVECWGAGGGGGGSTSSTSKYTGGGGAGGNYVKNVSVSVSPGNVYTITIGTGGAGGSTTSTTCNGSNGTATSFSGTGITTITAAGGNAGLGGQSALSAGTGGVASSTGNAGFSGSFSYAGGSGTTATWVSSSSGKSGPGGGAAGTNGAGSSSATGVITAGAPGTGGGAGGAGLSASGTGNVGAAPGGGGGGGFGSSGAGGKGGNGQLIITYSASTGPQISLSTNTTPLTAFTTTTTSASAAQVVNVSGSNLTTAIVLTSPADYEISLNSSTGFTNTISISPVSGTVSTSSVYVRLKSGLSVGNFNENVSVVSTGATSQNIVCIGTVTAPLIPTINTPSVVSLTGFNYGFGNGPSIEQSFTISAQNLTDSLRLSVSSTNFEITTTSGSNYISGIGVLSLAPTEGAITTTIYVRMKAGLAIGNYAGDLITLSSTGATAQTAACNGTVTATSAIIVQPFSQSVCSSANVQFIAKSSVVQSVKWQRSTDGTIWVDITANLDAGTVYSGFQTDTLKLTGTAITMDFFQYRAVYTNAISNTAILTVTSSISGPITISGNSSLCAGSSITLLATAGSTSTATINPDDFLVPKFSAVTVTKNVAYGTPNGSFHLVDIYSPTGDTTTNRPAVMFFHGGGFQTGNDKTQSYVVSFCTYLAKCGYVAFAPNYTVGGGHTFAQNLLAVQDADLCLNWIRANGSTYNYNANYLFEGGGSAGAHLSCNFCFADGSPNYNGYQVNLSNVIAFADCWGSSPNADRLYNYSSLNNQSMPVFIVQGSADQTVPVQESITLDGYLNTAGAYHDFWEIPGETHGCPNHIPAISDTMAHFFNRAWKRRGVGVVSGNTPVTGGVWSSNNSGVATVNAQMGVVTAVSSGTATITYTLTSCSGTISSSKVITVNPLLTASSSVSACNSYTWRGTTYNTSGDKVFTKSNTSGCDSVFTLHLTINNPTSSIETITACETYNWHGVIYNSSTATPTFTTVNAAGCDSVINLHLTIKNGTHQTLTASACGSYTWNGSTYTSSGNYVYNYVNTSGCASADTLHLTMVTGTHNVIAPSVCNSYTWNGITYTIGGNYVYNYTNAGGCASADTLHLTILSPTHYSFTQAACNSYTWNGTTYTSSGDYVFNYINGSGCASSDTLHLTIIPATHNNYTQTACNSFNWNGVTYTASGNYVYTYNNSGGCASSDSLHLTIYNSSAQSFNIASCGPYSWNGTVYTSSGTYYFNYANIYGCSSVDTLHLTVSTPVYTAVSVNTCGAYTWNGNVYTATGNYTYSHLLASGCNQTDTLHLTVNTASHITQSVNSCSAYSWHGISYSVSGTYTYAYTNNSGCASTDTLLLNMLVKPTGVISGNAFYCNGAAQNTALTIAVTGTGPWTGSLSDGTLFSGNVSPIIVNVAPASTTNYTISGLSDANCVALSSGLTGQAVITISNNAVITPAFINGVNNINQCDSIQTYSVNPIAGLNYNWTVTGTGNTILSGQGTASVVIKMKVAGTISVVQSNACGSSVSSSLAVTKAVPATPGVIYQRIYPTTIAANTNVCLFTQSAYLISGQADVFMINSIPKASGYIWKVPSGSIVNRLSDTAIAVIFPDTLTLSVSSPRYIQVFSLSACDTSLVRSLTLTRTAPVTPASILNADGVTAATGSVCSFVGSTPQIYKIKKVVTANGYNWSLSSGRFAIMQHLNPAGVNDTVVSINYLAGFTKDTIVVATVNGCGASVAKKLAVSAILPPATPSLIVSSSGSWNACIGNQVQYTVSSPAPSASQSPTVKYRWTIPAKTQILSANSDSSIITLSFLATYTGGAMTVKGVSACGIAGTAKSQTLTHTGCAAGTKIAGNLLPTATDGLFIMNASLYPNPANDAFKIIVSTGDKHTCSVQMDILDPAGNSLRKYQLINLNGRAEATISNLNLPAGVYLIRYSIGKNFGITRLLIEH